MIADMMKKHQKILGFIGGVIACFVALVFSVARMVVNPEGRGVAASRLHVAVTPAAHRDGEGRSKRIIDKDNVFGICLAMAVGAEEQAGSFGLVDENGKYNQDNTIASIKPELNSAKDELLQDLNRQDTLIVRVKAGY